MQILLLKWNLSSPKKFFDKSENENDRKRGILRKNSKCTEKTKVVRIEKYCVKVIVNLRDTKGSNEAAINKEKQLNYSIFLNIGMNFLFFFVFTVIDGPF